MQTVVNYNIINGPVIGSAILQGSDNNNVTIANVTDLGEFEAELLRMFRGLDVRGRIAALSYLCALEKGTALPAGMEV